MQPKVRRPLELSSLYDDLLGTGRAPSTEVLEIGQVEPPDDVAELLKVDPGAPVLKLMRLRCSDGRPIAMMTNYLPEQVGELTAADLEQHGLYEPMRRRGIQLHAATQTVGARTASATEARQLEERRNAALLTMQRITYDDHGSRRVRHPHLCRQPILLRNRPAELID